MLHNVLNKNSSRNCFQSKFLTKKKKDLEGLISKPMIY